MSSQNSQEDDDDDDEVQLSKVDLNLEKWHKLPPIAPMGKVDTDSDISTDSSSTSGKQLKSPHTVLKDSPTKSLDRSRSISPTSPQNEDRAEHYQRLLQEAEHSLSCRDVLIAMLQEQLRKIENLYKQSLDDTQNIRYKYCVTTQELSNLRTISQKYREDIETLVKEKSECCSKKELQKLQNEADQWRSQYKRLSKEVQVMENQVLTAAEKVSKEIQVELGQDQEFRIDADVLKDYYNSIKNSLQEQNEKMELIIKKLQDDLSQSENDRRKLEKELISSEDQLVKMNGKACKDGTCTEQLRVENKQLRKELDNLKTENKQLSGRQKNTRVINEDSSQLLSRQEFETSGRKVETENLKKEVETLKAEIEELNEKNARLQNEVDEIDKVKKEKSLGEQEITTLLHISNAPAKITDNMLTNSEKENSDLQEKAEILNTSDKFQECHCCSHKDDNKDKNENSLLATSTQESGVSFILPSEHLQAELLLLQKENSKLKLKIKKMQGDDKASDEMEKNTVEIVNLRRLVKQKQEEIDRLVHEADTSASRKNEIIQELQRTNELMKNDYEELLQANVSLKRDLEEKTTNLTEKQASLQTLIAENDKQKVKDNSTEEYEAALQENSRITEELNIKIQELGAVTNDMKKLTVEIIEKEALIQTLYAKIEKLKVEHKNCEDCKKVTEENRKTKDELNDKTKQLDAVKSDLQKKTLDITKKEAIIEGLNSEIEEVKAKLNNSADYNKVIRENGNVKNELEKKRKELAEKVSKMTCLQTKIEELKEEFAKTEEERGNYSKELQCRVNCVSKIHKLESELIESTAVIEKLKQDDENLKLQIDMMTKTLQQYKEEAEFKKLENDKLRKKEKQLESVVACIRRNSESITREYSKEIEKSKTSLSETTEEYNNFKQESENNVRKLSDKNAELTKLLQQKNEEIKELEDKINEVTQELEKAKWRHQKDLNVHERSLSEIKFLFKNKEEELTSATTELQGQEQILHELEEDNNRLKQLLTQQQLLREDTQKQDNDENRLQSMSQQISQANKIKMLEENYNREKIKNSKLHSFVSNVRKELNNLKIQIQDLLKNLELKLKQLKMDIKSNKCGTTPTTRKGLSEMLDCIGKFNSSVLQQDFCTKLPNNSKSIEETENYSYYNDETKSSDIRTDQTSKTSGCITMDYKYRNTTAKAVQGPSATTNVNKNIPDYKEDFSDMTIKDLQLKKEYLLLKVKSIDEKLDSGSSLNPDHPSVTKILTPQRISSSESDLTSHTKTNDKGSYCACPQPSEVETEDLLFKGKHCSDKIDPIDEKLEINTHIIKENKENQTFNKINNENKFCSSSSSAYWKKNLEIMQQMASDINAMKVGLTMKGENSTKSLQNKSVKGPTNHKCLYNNRLQIHITDLQEQLKATCLMTKEIDELQHQLKLQHSKLKEFQATSQFGKYTNKSYCTAHPSPTIKASLENTEEYGLPGNVTKEEKEKSESSKLAEKRTQMTECSQCPPLRSASVQPTSDSLAQNACNASKETKQQYESKTEALHGVSQNIKKANSPTSAIPMLVQNSHKKLKCKCLPNSTPQSKSNSDEGSPKHHKPKSLEKNQPNSDLKTLYEKPAISQLCSVSKGKNAPQCVCVKTHPNHTPTSQLPVTTTVPKNCNCVWTSNRKDITLSEKKNKHDVNSTTQSAKDCDKICSLQSCEHVNEDLNALSD